MTTTFNIQRIDTNFPLSNYRVGQREAIECVMEAFNTGHKFVFLEAPTGSGKSAIGFTIAQFVDYSYYLAPQKFLQDQLTHDFGERGKNLGKLRPMIDLKGRNAYPCNYWERCLDGNLPEDLMLDNDTRKRYAELSYRKLGCDQGQCKRDGKSKLAHCVEPFVSCPYFKRLYKAMRSKVCLMNFHSFLYQSAISKQFGKRNLMIIDECHNAEDILLKFIELKITDRYFVKDNVNFPKLSTVKAYLDYFDEINLRELMLEKQNMARIADDIREADEWKNRIYKLDYLKQADPERWVCEWSEVSSGASRTIGIKPIYVDDFAQEYLFGLADHVLMMSATILSKNIMCTALGIDRDSAKSFQLASTFPARYRRLHYRPCGAMSFKKKAETMPELIDEVTHLCRHHAGQRGIVHTHTYEIAEKLMSGCGKDVRSRFLFQRNIEFDGDKNLLLDKHKTSTDSIIIAPAMHEGLDLKDDFGRFQIICKVPYPSKADPQVAARMEISSEYYNWRTATKLVQSYGRIYRHERDHGVTYVLDSNFKYFVRETEHMLPDWFLEAIKWE